MPATVTRAAATLSKNLRKTESGAVGSSPGRGARGAPFAVLTYYFLMALLPSTAAAQTREVSVSITPRAAAAVKDGRYPEGRIPYILRVQGLRLPNDKASRITVYGESPDAASSGKKADLMLGFVEGMGWRGGAKLGAARDFVIPLSQRAAGYFEGKSGQVKLWFHLEGVGRLIYASVEADIGGPAAEKPK